MEIVIIEAGDTYTDRIGTLHLETTGGDAQATKPGEALYTAVMAGLKERDRIMQQAQWIREEMARRASTLDRLPALIAEALRERTLKESGSITITDTDGYAY